MKHKTKYKQRTAKSALKPTIFILLELILFALIVYIALEIGHLPLTFVSILGCLYYLLTSSMPRFKKVIKRQKAYHRLKRHNIITDKEYY